MDVHISVSVSVSVRVNTHAETYVDWSFDVSPPHGHHEHPRPLTPARKPHLVLGQGGGRGSRFMIRVMRMGVGVTVLARVMAGARVEVRVK